MTTESTSAEQQHTEKPDVAVENEQPEQTTGVDQAAESDDSESSVEELQADLEKAQQTIKDYWDQIMRLNAEIENNRRRAQRDIEHAHKYSVQGFVESLLPLGDSMELGLNAANEDNANIDAIREGMVMTLDMFSQICNKNGIEVIDPNGEKFNPEHHQAMSMIENNDVEPNTVLNVMQKGYLLNGRLIRPAMVVVSKTS